MASEARYLLDTSVFLWAGGDSSKLSSFSLAAIEDESAVRLVSVASVWEMQIKHGLGKLPLPEEANHLALRFMNRLSAEPLNISLDHIGRLYELPLVHRDPFDRILVAQAIAEKLTIISPDAALRAYPVNVLW